jgi:hypothetical protein
MVIPYRTNSTGLYAHLHIYKRITGSRENYINAWPFHMQAAAVRMHGHLFKETAIVNML